MRISVIGSINMDVLNRVSSHPKLGETTLGFKTSYYPGGKGANQAVAAARAGASVWMVGAVGTDVFGADLLSQLKRMGVDTTHVQQKGEGSGVAFITVDDNGENTIILSPGANAMVSDSDVQSAADIIARSNMLLLQNEIPWEATFAAMKMARRYQVPVVFNAAPAVELPSDVMQWIDVLVVNELETGTILHQDVHSVQDAAAAAEDIILMGIPAVIITLGANGCFYADQQGVRVHTPAFAVKSVDTTAAGDTFIGAFAAVGILGDVQYALQFASAASALSVTRNGSQASIPLKSEILEFLAGNPPVLR